MKINKKALVAVLLVGSILLSACGDKADGKRNKKNKKEEHRARILDTYTLDDIEEKTNAKEMVESVYYNEDCYRVNSNNKYNNARFIIFDSEVEAQEFYEDAIEDYLLSKSYSDDKYSIGYEYGVCDASIIDMVLVDKNIVMIAETAIYGDWAVVDGEDSEACGTVYLDDDDIAKIVEEWS